MEKAKIIEAVDSEIIYQADKWKHTKDGGENHEIAAWILYMQHHLNKAAALSSTASPEREALAELRKVVALGFKCFGQHGVPARPLDLL